MKLRIVVLIVLMITGLVGEGAVTIAAPIPGASAFSITDPEFLTYVPEIGGIGFEFIPKMDMVVNQLGIFDNDGLAGDHFVGIYGPDYSFLAATTVTASDTKDAYFRYASIAPLTLSEGTTYIILAEAGSDDYVIDAATFVTNKIEFSNAAYYNPTPGLSQLDDSLLELEGTTFPSYFGPNFRYTAVPVPSGIWLLGSGLLFLVGRKKRTPFSS